jgi:hypothetical protein
MESNKEALSSIEEQEQIVCASCKSVLSRNHFKVPLCADCRNNFIKFPIPVWIKAFGTGILIILAFSLSQLSKNLTTGIHLQRGKEAAKGHNFLTAQNEFEQVVQKEPGYIEGQGRLLLAAYYNNDLTTLGNVYQKLVNKNFENEDLYGEINSVAQHLNTYYPSDSFLVVMEEYNGKVDSIPGKAFQDFFAKNSEDYFAITAYASNTFDQKNYKVTDSLLNTVLAFDRNNQNALAMKIPLKREMLQFDSSYYYANRILKINKQSLYALASKVRTLLKEKKDEDALKLAEYTYNMNKRDLYSMSSLAMAYHYKNDTAKRDAIIAAIEKDSTAASYSTYVKDVISGKENFRN